MMKGKTMIKIEEISKIVTNIINNNYKVMPTDLSKIIDFKNQQEKVNELSKEHIQLSYDFEYMLVHGIKDDMKYTKTANRLLTVREKLQEILNWKLESELK